MHHCYLRDVERLHGVCTCERDCPSVMVSVHMKGIARSVVTLDLL
jgi:hypothetical protein